MDLMRTLQDVWKVRHEIPRLPVWVLLKCFGGPLWTHAQRVCPQGPVALLLPGFCESPNELVCIASELTHAGYHPMPLDGLGWNVQSLREMVDSGANVLRALRRQRRRVLLVGHSKGGIAAYALASRFPKTAIGVLLLGAPMHGSRLAEVVSAIPFVRNLDSIRDLTPRSSFLRTLVRRHPRCPVFMASSPEDGLAPDDRCAWNEGQHVSLRETRGHIALLLSQEVRDHVRTIAVTLRPGA